MTNKHIFLSADGLVLKALKGAVALNPSLKLHAASKSVCISNESHIPENTQTTPRKIAVISGGGGGHEPAHAGYTGYGMLSASVSGDIFASPSAKQILQTIFLASSSGTSESETEQMTETAWRDVLVIINNYTGDRLNFGLAIEKALASSYMKVESVVVADDVSLLRPTSDSGPMQRKSSVGARGLAGNILVCKILGAFAQRGGGIAQAKILGDAIVGSLASVGVGLEHCHVPGREPNSSNAMTIGEDEYEIGLGLHNEPGVSRKNMGGPINLVAEMLSIINNSKALQNDATVSDNTRAVLFINNLGGLSQLELGAILDEVMQQLIEQILEESAAWTFSTTILDLLDDPTEAVAWIGARRWPVEARNIQENENLNPNATPRLPLPPEPTRVSKGMHDTSNGAVEESIRSACEAVLLHQEEMTEFDTILGDGDCGDTFATAIIGVLDKREIDLEKMAPSEVIKFIGDVLEDQMGGTIGALFAIFFTALSTALKGAERPATLPHWAAALDVALKALKKYTPAEPGDRTLLDALTPFCQTLALEGSTLVEATDAAKRGAEGTRTMQPVLGRAAYITIPSGMELLLPDPGAWGVWVILDGICRGLSRSE
ncbi:hypothetical protein H0H92_014336 [Tricholoma furcatifolium]|nr:hypothetical protein H0H92_014336 [Tricholoma furcatifolium]